MPRLIDADVLVATLDRLADDPWNANANTTWSKAYTYAVELINEQNSVVEVEKPINKVLVYGVEYVPVVRCRDCEWYKTNYTWNGKERKVCGIEPFEPIREEEDYCSYGERKE